MNRALLLTVAATLILPGCRSRDDAGASDSAADSAAMAGMPGMGSGEMMSHMMDSMEVQLRMMDTASATTMQAILPMHQQMADSMISRMNEDMRRMNMATDSAWTNTVDSLRQDLSRMSAMPASEMMAMVPAHRARVMRLMQMHGTMIGKPPR